MKESALTKSIDKAQSDRRVQTPPDAAFGVRSGRWMVISAALSGAAFLAAWLTPAETPAPPLRLTASVADTATQSYDLISQIAGLGHDASSPAEETEGEFRASDSVPQGLVGPLDRAIAKPKVETETLKVDNGHTLMGMLEKAGVPKADASAVADAMKPVYSPKRIRSGQKFKATFAPPVAEPPMAQMSALTPIQTDQDDDDTSPVRRLLSLSFAPDAEHQITVHLTPPEGYFAEDVFRKLEARYQHIGATIDSSLYLSATQAGLPPGIVVEIIRMFSYDVDFQRDIQPGDEFEVFFNRFFTTEGQPAKVGDILAASMTISGKKHLLYRYETPNGDVEYFDSTGQSAKSLLMKTPVDGARISSGFGRRHHPILGYTRMHKGMDFAVPSGTPVMAAGSGTIAFAGKSGEYGNLVVISHGNKYTTAYAHLSSFGSGVHTGARVRQGEIVAFSGMTGLATGPHLHYEIRVNNAQINPATLKLASGKKLDGADLNSFLKERDHLDGLIAELPMQTKLADASLPSRLGNR